MPWTPEEKKEFFVTYWWTILLIVGCIGAFVTWEAMTYKDPSCGFPASAGILCESVSVDDSTITLEIRNLQNKSITLTNVSLTSCVRTEAMDIPAFDKRNVAIECVTEPGKLRERAIVHYTYEDYNLQDRAKISYYVP